ncbi:hypothetical protein [Streptomyces sp. NPDC000880]
MNSENRSRSSLGPLPRRSALLAGGTIASLVLTLVGITSPALAASQSGMASDGVSVAGPSGGDDCTVVTSQGKSVRVGGDDDRCRGDKGDRGERGERGPRGPRGATGNTGPAGPCNDIDSFNYPTAVAPTHQIAAALFDPVAGPVEAYAAVRTVGTDFTTWVPLFPPTDPVDGVPLPADLCSITVSTDGAIEVDPDPLPLTVPIIIQGLTTAGVVWETECDFNPVGPALTCDGDWDAVTSPTSP